MEADSSTTRYQTLHADQQKNMCTPEFIYFDLGNVLLYFSRERQFTQMANVLGISPEEVDHLVEENDLMHRCETGTVSPEQAHSILCKAVGQDCNFASLYLAGSNIFELNVSILPLITQLTRNGHRLGILSNTSANHWEYCQRHFAILRDCFEQAILSYEVGEMKPQEKIYQAAVQATGVPAEKIFYTDDLQPNIDGAINCGIDALLYTDTHSLVEGLRDRGLQITL